MKPAYVLAWRSPCMPAHACWYYRHAHIAAKDELYMRSRRYDVKPVKVRQVPDYTPLMDERS